MLAPFVFGRLFFIELFFMEICGFYIAKMGERLLCLWVCFNTLQNICVKFWYKQTIKRVYKRL